MHQGLICVMEGLLGIDSQVTLKKRNFDAEVLAFFVPSRVLSDNEAKEGRETRYSYWGQSDFEVLKRCGKIEQERPRKFQLASRNSASQVVKVRETRTRGASELKF